MFIHERENEYLEMIAVLSESTIGKRPSLPIQPSILTPIAIERILHGVKVPVTRSEIRDHGLKLPSVRSFAPRSIGRMMILFETHNMCTRGTVQFQP